MQQLTESKSKIWGKIFWNIMVGISVGFIANHLYWAYTNQNKLYYTLSHDDERTRFTLTLSNKTKKDIEHLEITLDFKDKLQRARIFLGYSLKPTEVELNKPNFSHTIDLVPKGLNVRIDIDSQYRGNSIETEPVIEAEALHA